MNLNIKRRLLMCILAAVCTCSLLINTACSSDDAEGAAGSTQAGTIAEEYAADNSAADDSAAGEAQDEIAAAEEGTAEAADNGDVDVYRTVSEGGRLTYEKLNRSGAPSLDEIVDAIPAYSGTPAAWINEDRPYFSDKYMKAESFEYYSPLDSLGRCGICIACVGQDLMPTEERGNISGIKPTGWHSVEYSNVDGGHLYNRCHLIAYMLTGENDNSRNLITGTRYMNVEGMLPREELVNDYVERTGNHVLYRITPVFKGNNLVASGVIMEAKSVEDNGAGLQFNVYVYNRQPGIKIDYSNGDSRLMASESKTTKSAAGSSNSDSTKGDYVANTNSGKFHYSWCSSVSSMSDHNKYVYKGKRQKLIDMGYEPCGSCCP